MASTRPMGFSPTTRPLALRLRAPLAGQAAARFAVNAVAVGRRTATHATGSMLAREAAYR
jgi:hypothetical protein